MKKIIALFLFDALMLCTYCNAQTDTVFTIYRQIVSASELKIYSNQISFLNLKKNLPTQCPVNEVSAIAFKNSVRINFHHRATINSSPAYYNATINLINGSFFTAFVDSIDQSFLYYHKYGDDAAVKTNVNDIIYLVYTNGIKADFITANSIKAIVAESESVKPKAIENRSNAPSYFGAMIGLSNAWIEADGSTNAKRSANNGIAAGIMLNKEFSKKSGFYVGLLYEQKGVNYQYNNSKSELETSYLTLPFTYQLFAGKSNLKVFFEGGFFMGFLLSGKNTLSTPDTLIEWDLLKGSYKTNRFDLGFVLGTGMKYKYQSHQFTGGIRYALGLATLNPDPLEYYPYYVSYGSPNRSFVFYVSYGIDIISYKQQNKAPVNLK